MVFVTCVITFSLGYFAYTDDLPLYLRLLPHATNVLWGLTAIGGLLSVIVLWFAIRSQISVADLELGPINVIMPKASLSMQTIIVPYTAIMKVNVVKI